MTKRESIRQARRSQLARLIRQGLQKDESELRLTAILPEFTGEARFPLLSQLHIFIDHQPLNAPHPGAGGHTPRVIKLDRAAKVYAASVLGDDQPAPYIEDGTPIGDPIFTTRVRV